MADHAAKTQQPNFYGILGIHKSASLGDIAKAYKNLLWKWNPDRNSNKAEAEHRIASINEAYRVLSARKREEADASKRDDTKSPENSNHYRFGDSDNDELVISSPTLLSTTSNRITPNGTPRTFGDGSVHRKTASIPSPREFHSGGVETPTTPTSADEMSSAAFSKMASRRTPTPIIFSQTTARRKAKPIEKKLECTLEELCHGAGKKVKITRDVISSEGLIVQEEEVLKIKIKPGWKKGTKITFEGKGDEKPGLLPADIIFIIDEKRHPIYKREGDDLELGVEIPLVQALTGCDISVPLLGGEKMDVSVDDIIFPGYEKRIPGQGMPISKEDGRRGDLVLKFLVEFPTDLSKEKRTFLANVLEECF